MEYYARGFPLVIGVGKIYDLCFSVRRNASLETIVVYRSVKYSLFDRVDYPCTVFGFIYLEGISLVFRGPVLVSSRDWYNFLLSCTAFAGQF